MPIVVIFEVNTTAIQYLLLYITFFSIGLPILFFLLFKRKSKVRAEWVIFAYLCYMFANEAVSFYLQQIGSNFVLSLFAIYTIVELILLSYYFYLLNYKNKILRIVIVCILALFFLISIPNLFTHKFMENWDSKAIGIESLIIIALSGIYLFNQIRKSNNFGIFNTFNFWVVVTFLLYFSGTFFLNIMADTMRKNHEYQMLYFYINSSFVFLRNILLTVAVTKKSIIPGNKERPQSSFDSDFNYSINT